MLTLCAKDSLYKQQGIYTQTHRTRQAVFNSSEDVDKTLVISSRKSSGICINVPERVAQNAQGLTRKCEKKKSISSFKLKKKKSSEWEVENHQANVDQ